MTFSKMLFVEFSANALFGHAKEATEEVDDCVDDCLEATRLTLAVIDLDGLVGVGGVFTGNFNLTQEASVAAFAIVYHNPIVTESIAIGLLTYRAGLGSITICLKPAMTDLCDDLAVADDLVTVKAMDLSGMSLGGTGSTNSSLECDVRVLAGSLGRRTAGINCDAVSTALSGKLGIGDRINGGGELQGNDIAVTGESRICGYARYPTVNVFRLKTYAVDLKLYYAGVCNNDLGIRIEASGICIVGYVDIRRRLVVGNGDTVLLPNLL
jgi:hypothetical protein